jgi:hypothetical protein
MGTSAPAPVSTASLGFPEIVRRSIVPRRAVWRSRLLSSQPLHTKPDPAAKILQLLTDLADPTTALAKQLSRYLREQRELAGGGAWARCFESYDTLVAFAEPYRAMLRFADEHMPKGDVTILDVGAATLNLSLYLILKDGQRRLVAVDPSRSGMIIGRKKIELAAGPENITKHRAFASSILDPLFPASNVHGAIVTNLLGNVPERKAVFHRLKQLVRGGGTVVLFEPTNRFREVERMKRFMLDLALSAAANHSPVNEFDLALVGAVHLETFTTALYQGPTLLPARELETGAVNAGFEVVASKPFFGGMVRALALKKP